MALKFKDTLVEQMKQVGVYDVKIANPHDGFEHAQPNRHPLELMPGCNSVIVFALPRTDVINNKLLIGVRCSEAQALGSYSKNLHTSEPEMYKPYKAVSLMPLYGYLKATSLLNEAGFRFMISVDNLFNAEQDSAPTIPYKLCAHEAGLGVYGRSGVIIHPDLGNRMILGAVLTDARLEPDKKLEDYDPCGDCEELYCVRACPAEAYGESESYHGVWSKEKCQAKRKELKEKENYKCNKCWDVCPIGKYDFDELCVLGITDNDVIEKLTSWCGRIQEGL